MAISSIINLIFLFLIVRLLTLLVKWLVNYLLNIKNYWTVKGWPSIPIVGNLHQFKNNGVDMLKAFKSMAEEFKDVNFFKFFRGWVPIIIFHKAENLDILFSGSQNNEKTFDYDFVREWLKDGLLLSSGEKWSHRRKIITPTFHFDILRDYLVIMNENVDIMIQKLVSAAEAKRIIKIDQFISQLTLDIIAETAMGYKIDSQLNNENEYTKAIYKISKLLQYRTCNPLHWSDLIYKYTKSGREHDRCLKTLHKFTRDIITKRDQDFEINNYGTQGRVAFLDMLLKIKHTENTLTFSDIQEEVDTFMFEGHDTTTYAASWTCHLLGSHPQVQQKVQDELDSVFNGSERHLTNEDLGKLKYLECVIKEGLRLFPPVSFHGRTMSEDVTVSGQLITKGTTVYVFPYMIHRDVKYFPDPEKFDPDRFLAENSFNRHPYAFVPFAAGRRNCVGQRFAMMELKVILASVFRKFNVVSLSSTKEIEPSNDVLLKPNNGCPVKLNLRTE